jgi:hypothetical protein
MKQFRNTYYYVTEEGKVYSNRFGKMKELKGSNCKGYLLIGINMDNKHKTHFIHRLVAECYLENYSEELKVNHKNLIKTDNRLENLEMVTAKENSHHYWKSIDKNWEEKNSHDYYLLNKEKYMLYSKNYYNKHKIYLSYYNKEYRIKHKEEILEKQKEYRNTEEFKIKQRLYRKEYNKTEKQKAYRNSEEWKQYQKEYQIKYRLLKNNL